MDIYVRQAGVNERRAKRHMTTDASCRECGLIEDTVHALHDCAWVRRIWEHLIPNPGARHHFFRLSREAWIDSNLHTDVMVRGIPWSTIFGVGFGGYGGIGTQECSMKEPAST